MLKIKQVPFFFENLTSKPFVKHAADLGGLLEVSCTDLQVSPVQVGDSSCPGHMGIRLNLNQATHDGFLWPKGSVCGEVPVVVAEAGPIEIILNSSTIKWVGQIHWLWGIAGGKTESSSCGKLA